MLRECYLEERLDSALFSTSGVSSEVGTGEEPPKSDLLSLSDAVSPSSLFSDSDSCRTNRAQGVSAAPLQEPLPTLTSTLLLHGRGRRIKYSGYYTDRNILRCFRCHPGGVCWSLSPSSRHREGAVPPAQLRRLQVDE